MANPLPSLDNSEIILHDKLAENTYRVRLSLKKGAFHAFRPGMFSMIQVQNNTFDPLLNRPFSISFINKKEGWFDILYRIVGKGTEIMSRKRVGEKLKTLAPLGHGYPKRGESNASIILIGGGIGVAPLLSFFGTKDPSIHALFWGVKSRSEYINLETLYPSLRNVTFQLSSEDGAIGTKGTVVDLFRAYIDSNHKTKVIVFACGPTKMLHALHKLCDGIKIPLYVSVESRMACGMGYCFGCTLPWVNGGYLKVCHDGPVFNSASIDWEDIGNDYP